MTSPAATPSPPPPLDRGWLWTVRIIILVTLALVSAPTLLLNPVLLPLVWPFWVPYLIAFFLLGAKTLRQGLAWAAGMGATAFLAALANLLSTISSLPQDVGAMADARRVLIGSFVPFALAQAGLVAAAIKTYYSLGPPSAGRRPLRWGFVLGAVCILIPFTWSFRTAASIRSQQMEQAGRESRAQWQASSEARAVSFIKRMSLCAEVYAAERPGLGYPASQALMGPEGSNCIDPALARGEAGGYTFTYTAGEAPAGAPVSHYTLSARPIQYEHPAQASFFSDESRLLRATREDRAATPDDPPW